MDGQRVWTCGVGCCSGRSGAGTGGQAGPFGPVDRTGRVLRIETAAAGGGRCHFGAGPGPVKLDRLILEARLPLCALCLDPTSRAGPCRERSNQPPTPDTSGLSDLTMTHPSHYPQTQDRPSRPPPQKQQQQQQRPESEQRPLCGADEPWRGKRTRSTCRSSC